MFLFAIQGMASASQIAARNIDELMDSSVYVFIGEVEKTTLISDDGMNGKEYEAIIKVHNVIKGEVGSQTLRLPMFGGGVKGFDIILEDNQKAVFFLRSIENGLGKLTHWGSVAIFDEPYFQ